MDTDSMVCMNMHFADFAACNTMSSLAYSRWKFQAQKAKFELHLDKLWTEADNCTYKKSSC